MPAKAIFSTATTDARLAALGQQIRLHRKALKVSATSAAEAAGLSRVTFHRIESGEPSVTMGAYLNAMAALGLELSVAAPTVATAEPPTHDTKDWIPVRVRLADYPELKRLAWQVHGTDALTPSEAFGIYERNGRHLDPSSMAPHERDLMNALRLALGNGKADV